MTPEPAPGLDAPSLARRLAWSLPVGALVAADQASKAIVFERLAHGERRPLAGDWLAFWTSENFGAIQSLGESSPYLLVGGRIAAVLVLGYYVLLRARSSTTLRLSLGLILAGALGNLLDNLLRTPPEGRAFGGVRDFVDVYFARWDWHFPTFNLADSCITCGALVLILSSFVSDVRPREAGEGARRLGSPGVD